MKFKEAFKGAVALFCIVQTCLLSVALVSPATHSWVCHSDIVSGVEACVATAGHDYHHDNGSKPSSHSDQDDHHDGACPVSLFSQGVTGLGFNPIPLESLATHCGPALVDTGVILIACRGDSIQARAPPSA